MMLLFSNPVFAEDQAGKVKDNVVYAGINEQAEESTLRHFKNGLNSSLLSLVYTTIKVDIAIIGGVVGDMACPLGGFDNGISINMGFFYGRYITNR